MPLRSILHQTKQLLFRNARERRQERTAGALCQVFASFINHDGKATKRELEIVYDFVRDVFPDRDHGLLGSKLEAAVTQPQNFTPSLKHLKKHLPAELRLPFALQLYSVFRAGGGHKEERERLNSVLEAIGSRKLAKTLALELESLDAPKSRRLPRVDFGPGPENEVRLPPGPETPRFRCYHAGNLILVRNLTNRGLWVRGRQVDPDRLIRISLNDEVVAGPSRFTYNDLSFFLQVGQKGPSPVYFLMEDNGNLSLVRNKSRAALAQIIFGHRIQVTPLQNGRLTGTQGDPLAIGTTYERDGHDLIRLENQEAVTLDSLRRLTLQTGQRFILPGGRRKVRVTNDPHQLSGDSLLLTPGLAGRFVIEIEFDPASGLGETRVLESTEPILTNGRPLDETPLPDGSLIRLSDRQALRCRFSDNILDEERNLVRDLVVENLNHRFWKGGKAIDSLSFKLLRGQMMCIIGPSGSGKSTLLEILAGQRRPKSGTIRLNGISLYEGSSRLAPLISFMPQEEALGEKLTAREHLAHAAAIRRPHLSEAAIAKRVSYLLGELGLERIGDRQVGSPESKSLSGGERSRLNAGLDLIGGGEIFLFDEPISGLSSKDAENVIESLHGLAQDKIVVASLHRPSEKVLDAFDLVLLLDRGGKMAFFGTPSNLRAYFTDAVRDLGIDRDEASAARGADFVFEVLETSMLGRHPGSKAGRRFPPEFWQERFENHRVLDHLSRSTPTSDSSLVPMAGDPIPAPEPPSHGRRQKWMIFKTHLARSAKSKFRHRGTFFSAFLEAPLLAALIGLTLRASPDGSYQFHSALHLPSYLFLAVTVAMFFGLTNSATEVLRDRPTLRRERNCRPHPLLYLGSKFLVLTALISLQASVFIFVSQAILELRGMFWVHLGWMILTGCCGTSLALMISVMARSERTALGAIPLTLVPQILLAGALIPFSEMNRGLFIGADQGRDAGSEPVPSTIMPLRYAFEGSMVSQATQNPFEKARQPLQDSIDTLKEKSSLNDQERRFLSENGDKLRVLYAALASDSETARHILSDPLAELARLQSDSLPPPGQKDRPVSQFFVNDRVDGMVELAETLRIDVRRRDQPLIFMAREKTILGINVSTQVYCASFLALLTLFFFLPATTLLHHSITKH